MRAGRPRGLRAALRGGGAETLRRQPAYPRQSWRRRGGHAGGLREDLAQRRPLPGRARQRPGWIVAIARNTAIDRLRARRAPTRDIADMVDLADPGPTPEASAATADDRRRIERCLGQLPPDRARAVRAAYVEGHSYDELARALRRAAQYHADLAAAGADRAQEVPRVMSDARSSSTTCPTIPTPCWPPSTCCGCSTRPRRPPAPTASPRDPAFAAEVARWQAAFEALDAAFAPAAPPRAAAGARRGAAVRPAAVAAGAALGQRRALARRGGGGGRRALALGYLGRTGPEVEAPELVATVAPTVGDVQLVALVDREAGLIRFTRLAGEAAARPVVRALAAAGGRDGAGIARRHPDRRAVLGADPGGLAARVGPGAQILVSNEVEGGSPTGQPQGDVLAGGAISEL